MANRGDKLTDFVTAAWYNQVTEAVNHINRGVPNKTLISDPGIVIVHNHEAVAKEKYAAVALGDAKIEYDENPEIGVHDAFHFDTQALSGTEPFNIAILQDTLPGEIGATARAMLIGLTWVLTDTAPTSDIVLHGQYLYVNSSDEVTWGHTGKGQIVKPSYFYDFDKYISLVILGPVNSGIKDVIYSEPSFIQMNDYEREVWVEGTYCSS